MQKLILKTIKAILIVLPLFFQSCKVDLPKNSNSILKIEKSRCYGECPVYYAILKEKNWIEFHPKENTEIKIDGGTITSGGLEGMRRDLLRELSKIGNMTSQIELAKAATERERDRNKQIASGLSEDRDAWKEDNQFAQDALARLKARTDTLTKNLRETRTNVLKLRTELEELNARLVAESKDTEQTAGNSAATREKAALR